MNFDIQYRPTHSLATANLAAGESVRAEASAMVSMTRNINVQTQGPMGDRGGFLRNMKRSILASETFFTNTYTATGNAGHVSFAPRLCGDMTVHDLKRGEQLLIQGGSYVAAPDSVLIDTQFQGFKAFLSGESFFFLSATGHGPILMNAFGGIETIDLNGEMIVDTGHLVALSASLSYSIDKAASGWIASYLSGEGFVLRVRGTGRLYLQSRNPAEYGKSVGRLLPPRRQ